MQPLARNWTSLRKEVKNLPRGQRKERKRLFKKVRLGLTRLERSLEKLSRLLKRLARRSGRRSKMSLAVRKRESNLLRVAKGMRRKQREMQRLVEMHLVLVELALCSTL